MPIIKNGVVINDPWIVIADEEPLPVSRPVIVTLARWLAEREALVARNGLVGVRLRSAELAEDIAADLDHLSLVAIEFPSLGDGRGYTTGRLLRERYGFRGELRAVGALFRDIFLFLHRCGFDAVEARDEVEAAAWRQAVGAITAAYQNAADHGAPRLRRRDSFGGGRTKKARLTTRGRA
jgi:uncharacterized protein (DUF934 family)